MLGQDLSQLPLESSPGSLRGRWGGWTHARDDRDLDHRRPRSLLPAALRGVGGPVKGESAPIQAGKRWPVERTHSWMNGYGKLRRFTDQRKIIVEFYLYLAAALTVIRRLINRARDLYRWPTNPTTRRLR